MCLPAVQKPVHTPTDTPLPEKRHGEADELERFIYRASHDLRGPLSRLIGLCNVATLEVSHVQALNYLYRIAYAANEMDEMLHKALKVELVKQKELNKAPVSLPKIVIAVIETVFKEEGRPPIAHVIDANPRLDLYRCFFIGTSHRKSG